MDQLLVVADRRRTVRRRLRVALGAGRPVSQRICKARTTDCIYFLVLLVMWVLGFINALVHAKDAWATMPDGLYLSVVAALLALVAAWIGYSGFRAGEVK